MLAKRTYKNQVTIPKAILGADLSGVDYFDVSRDGTAIVLRPVKISRPGEHIARIRAKFRALGITQKDITDAIRWARRKP